MSSAHDRVWILGSKGFSFFLLFHVFSSVNVSVFFVSTLVLAIVVRVLIDVLVLLVSGAIPVLLLLVVVLGRGFLSFSTAEFFILFFLLWLCLFLVWVHLTACTLMSFS